MSYRRRIRARASRTTRGEWITVIVCTLLVLAVVIFFAWYEEETTVRITDRWWASGTAIKWDEERYVCELEEVESCTGYGEDEVCTTTFVQNCSWETTTYTRCSARDSGRELPVRYPSPGCSMRPGDYRTSWESFYVRYNKLGDDDPGERRSSIRHSQWDEYVPNEDYEVRLDLIGHIRGKVR